MIFNEKDGGFIPEQQLFSTDDDALVIDKTKEIEEEVSKLQKGSAKKEKDEDVMLPIDDEDNTVSKEKDEEEEDKGKKKEEPKKVEKKETPKKEKVQDAEIDYKGIFEALKEKEVLTVDIPEDFKGSDDEVLGLFEEQMRSDRGEILNYYDSKYSGLISYLENGGDLRKWQKTHEEMRYDEMKFDDIAKDAQSKEKAYIDYYKSRGLEDDEIMANMKRAKDLEEFDQDVEKVFSKLQKLSKSQKEELHKEAARQKVEQEKQYKDFVTKISSTINDMDSFIPTTKLKKADKLAIEKLATGNEIWDELRKDPVKASVTLAALKYYKLLDGDFSKIMKDLETKATTNVTSQFIRTNTRGADSNATSFFNSEDTGKADNVLSAFAKTFGRK